MAASRGAWWRIARAACAVALLSAQALLCSAHESASWQRAQVGRVTRASLAGQRACVATAQGAVACLALRTGEIEWRQVLEDNDALDDALFASKAVITLSSAGKLLRAWATTDGALLWEDNTYSSASTGAGEEDAAHTGAHALLLLKDGAHETVATLARGRVQVRDAASGSLLWDVDASALASGAEMLTLMPSPDGQLLYAAGRTARGMLAAVALQRGGGQLVSAGTAAAAQELVPPYVALSSAAPAAGAPRPVLLVAAEAAGGGVGYVDLAQLAQGQATEVHRLPLTGGSASLAPTAAAGSADPGLRLRAVGLGFASLDTQAGLSVALLHAAVAPNARAGGAMPAALAQWPRGAALGAPVHLDAASPALHAPAVLIPENADGAVTIDVVDLATGDTTHTERVPELVLSERGAPVASFLGSYMRRNATRGFRVAVLSKDDSFMLLQQGRRVWAREEALADVRDLLALESPDASTGASVTASLFSLAPALKTASAMRHLITEAASSWARALVAADKQAAAPGAEHGTAAATGSGRVFVVLTACGKVLALSSDRGSLLWTWFPPAGHVAPTSLLLWRDSHAPLVLLAGLTADGAGTRLVWLDAHTGAVSGTSTAPLRAARLVPLPVLDEQGRRVVLLWERASGRLAVFPATEDAAARAAAAASHLYLHDADGPAGVVSGFAVSAAADGALRAVPAWSVALHAPVLAASVRPPDDVVFSRTRVRGDRSTAYKYLSPNTLLVATSIPRDAHHAAAGLEVFILDTVTGRFLYRVRHAAATGPVTAAAADNWFVYAYWSEAAQRTEVSVLELFEEGRSSGSLGAAITGALASRTTALTDGLGDSASSLAPPTLRVLGQTYSLSSQLSSMGVTVTRRGLTSRHVLLGTRSGRVVALDRRFVDPRRPTRPSAADREEGLVPYSEALPLLPGAHLTGATRLARLRGIAAAPAALESACHVLAYGLDLFYARTAPSQTFDTLGGGFSRALLAATLTALAIGAAVAGWAVHRDDLARKWQ